jgi:hypothetical protein
MQFFQCTNPEVREMGGLELFKINFQTLGEVWNDIDRPAVMEVPNKTFQWMCVTIMMAALQLAAHNIYGTVNGYISPLS